jgi:hypothetical protein
MDAPRGKPRPAGGKPRRERSEAQGKPHRSRRTNRRYYPRKPSAAAQVLIDAALDALGLLALIGAFQRMVPLPWVRSLEIAWMVVGVDLVFRTSLRDLLARPFTLLARVVRFVRVQLRRGRRPTQARVTEGDAGGRVGPEEAGLTEAVPEAAGAGA